ncbi:hypothetical protein Vretimale_9374 [Volvox reticuliferus]|uniref:Uncharacterized protein n=1 Tax=Volvox reticuliferus TaxID=1737510 RepID=A0A8J4LPC6_9CHLO|nr:hypothetical protein Vretimale_9374 [Volvox reticuliferus]
MSLGVKGDTSKRLGALLLRGWAMLGENCPDCQVPLMKERASNERLCVNCDTTFVPDGQGLRPTNRPLQKLADADPRQQQQRRQEEGGKEEEEEEEQEEEEEEQDQAQEEEREQDGHGLAGAPVGKPSSGAASSTDGPEDVADLLAAKMLQGWALLGKYCPRCNTVLVRSKVNKRMFCVACDAWVVPEADALQQQQQEQQRDEIQSQAERSQAVPAAAVQPAFGSITALPEASPVLPRQPQPQPQQHHAQSAPLPPSPLPPPPPQQQVTSLQPRSPDPRVHAAPGGLPAFVSEPAQLPSGPIPTGGVLSFSSDLQQPQQPYPQLQQSQPQLPLTYQQFFLPMAPVSTVTAGSATISRGSSPPQQWSGGGPSFTHEALLGALRAQSQQQQQVRSPLQGSSLQAGQAQAQGAGGNGTSLGAGGSSSGNGGNKQTSSTALLLTIGRTVALKMGEAQGLLERTPALDTERARSYVALISECLELLSKLHSLQQ